MEEFTNCQICCEKYDNISRIPLWLVACKPFLAGNNNLRAMLYKKITIFVFTKIKTGTY